MKVNLEDVGVKLRDPEGREVVFCPATHTPALLIKPQLVALVEVVVAPTPGGIPRDQSSSPRQLLAALWRVATTASRAPPGTIVEPPARAADLGRSQSTKVAGKPARSTLPLSMTERVMAGQRHVYRGRIWFMPASSSPCMLPMATASNWTSSGQGGIAAASWRHEGGMRFPVGGRHEGQFPAAQSESVTNRLSTPVRPA